MLSPVPINRIHCMAYCYNDVFSIAFTSRLPEATIENYMIQMLSENGIKSQLELEKYDPSLINKPQLIAANKSDLFESYEEAESYVQALKDEFEPKGIKVYTISAATGDGIKELLRAAFELIKTLPDEVMTFEQEYDPEVSLKNSEEPYTVYFDDEEDEYVIEGPRIEKMLGYTNLDSEKGFAFFQRFLKDNGMLDQLEDLGIKDGDTVRLYGHSFEYYK